MALVVLEGAFYFFISIIIVIFVYVYIYNVSYRVMTVGIVMTVPNKFRFCAVLTMATVITL